MCLHEWLQKNKITITEFAARVDVSRAHLSKVLTGAHKPSGMLKKLISYETGGDVTEESFNETPEAPFNIYQTAGQRGRRRQVSEVIG